MEAPVEEIGDGGQPDMRVRTDIDALPRDEFGRAHLVEKDEGSDHLALWCWQRAADLEITEVAGARNDERLDGVDGIAHGAIRVEGGVPAHDVCLLVRRDARLGVAGIHMRPRHGSKPAGTHRSCAKSRRWGAIGGKGFASARKPGNGHPATEGGGG
jgi:hypothetical protein